MKCSRQILSFTFLITVVMLSCKKKEQTAKTCINNGYFKFLKLGNKWIYDDSSSLGFTQTIMNIDSDETWTIGELKKRSYDEFLFLFSYKECNDWLYFSYPSNSMSQKYFPAKRNIGLKWTASSSDTTFTTYEVIDTNISVNTKAGNFVCDKIIFTATDYPYIDTLYFSNQYGKIKRDGNYSYSLKSISF